MQTIRTSWVYNFLLDLHISRYPIFLQILTISTCDVHNFPLNLHNSGYSIFFCKSRHSVYIMCTISRWIYTILKIQSFCKSKQSVHLLYTTSRWIYVTLDIQFFCKSKQSIHMMYPISRKIFRNSGYSIFHQIYPIRTYRVKYFS